MIIILCRIPTSTKKQDIIDYLKAPLKGNFFKKPGLIKNIKIIKLQDIQTSDLEIHGLVTIDSSDAAIRVIQKLNRKTFNGKHIAIREFIQRSWKNEKRINQQKNNQRNTFNKRKEDRRRSNLENISNNSSKFSSNRKFHRSL